MSPEMKVGTAFAAMLASLLPVMLLWATVMYWVLASLDAPPLVWGVYWLYIPARIFAVLAGNKFVAAVASFGRAK